ncbi:hypothetical protein AHMF7605_03200 [Adhaeribacter arboris]|uniref:Uncharacterized protein n=1 Tax=Adhaeribacter arboris TaxID=2072846 RepID=A0A2T2YAN9_9BACT|nr:hypothetical protein [Adhaeribacter arboris]PSR52601.1 hypothetical protein AHMF7605_03200 [Adhaeribacter arboris]
MLSSTENTALLLFTRTPQEEVLHKNLIEKQKVSAQKQFFHKLMEHARKLGQNSGLSFSW